MKVGASLLRLLGRLWHFAASFPISPKSSLCDSNLNLVSNFPHPFQIHRTENAKNESPAHVDLSFLGSYYFEDTSVDITYINDGTGDLALTPVPRTSNTSWHLVLPFPWFFYGKLRAELWVNTAGFISFQSQKTNQSCQCPQPTFERRRISDV